jgi:hypothetical protein
VPTHFFKSDFGKTQESEIVDNIGILPKVDLPALIKLDAEYDRDVHEQLKSINQ